MEKYIKAIIVMHGEVPPHTHDLSRLTSALAIIEPSLKLDRPEVLVLTDYAVNLRYDSDFWPTQTETADALNLARRIRGEVLAVIPQNMHPTAPSSI